MKKESGILFCSAQDIGCRREQQDVIEIASDIDGVFLAALADGMGGMRMGRECAELAVSAFIESFAACANGNISANLEFSAQRANEMVLRMAAANGAAGMAGSTLLAAALYGNELRWLSVGDSHLYLFREGALRQLNTDHNLRAKLIKAQKYSEEYEADGDVNLSALTSFVGIDRLSEVDISSEPERLYVGDLLLLCSDGLYNTLMDDEIEAALSSGGEDIAASLLEKVLAKAKAHQDNVSLIIISIAGGADEHGHDEGRTELIRRERGEDDFIRKLLRFLCPMR